LNFIEANGQIGGGGIKGYEGEGMDARETSITGELIMIGYEIGNILFEAIIDFYVKG
jgi:hypothetical protein